MIRNVTSEIGGVVDPEPITFMSQHADLYRLSGGDEIAELALDEAALDAVLLVEWPERAGDGLPADHLLIEITPGSSEADRELCCRAQGPASVALLDSIRAQAGH